MAKRILVLHGPNLNLLGERPGDAPDVTLSSVDRTLVETARAMGAEVRTLQSNQEGTLVDALQRDRKWADAVLVDAGPLALSGHVLADALQAVALPCVELSSVRKKSVLDCDGRVIGKGVEAYVSALQRLVADDPSGKKKPAKKAAAVKTPAVVQKARTLGRAAVAKTLGRASVTKGPGRAAEAKTLGRAAETKTLGRAAPKSIGRATIQAALTEAPARSRGLDGSITRSLVREKIAERLRGSLTPSGLATWARQQFLDIERGAPAESGHRELLEDTLQQLTLSAVPASRLSDDELIELMTQLEG